MHLDACFLYVMLLLQSFAYFLHFLPTNCLETVLVYKMHSTLSESRLKHGSETRSLACSIHLYTFVVVFLGSYPGSEDRSLALKAF